MAITRVQGPARGTTTTNSITLTMGATPTPGNVLILTYSGAGTTGNPSISSISETGVTWEKQASDGGITENSVTEIWYGVVGANPSSNITVNLTGGLGTTIAIANVCEYNGLATSNFLDKTAAGGNQTGVSISTGTTPNTTQAIELWVGVVDGAAQSSSYAFSAPTNGFALLDGACIFFTGTYYFASTFLEKIVSATGAAQCSCTSTPSSDGSNGCIATFKAATGGTLQTVTDSLGLSDAVLRHKAVLPIADVVGLADAILRHKTLTIADSVGAVDSVKGNKTLKIIDVVVLAETIKALKTLIITDQIQLAELLDALKGGILKFVADSVGLADSVLLNKMLAIADSVTLLDSASTPSRVIRALESIVLVDNAFVNKTLQITEAISVAEIVEVGAGSIKKTKLFLILGDLAVQLMGD